MSLMRTQISRRSLFAGIAATAIAPTLPRLARGPAVSGLAFGGPYRSPRWGIYDDSFLGQNVVGVRMAFYRGRYYRILPGRIG